MSVLSGGTDALVQLLARRKVEQQQDMLRALQVADKQKQWHAEKERIRQNDEQLKQTAENQRLLRLEADRRQAEVERLHEQQLATNIQENILPAEEAGARSAELLQKFGLDPGVIQKTASGLELNPASSVAGPTGQAAVLKVLPDRFKSLGGIKWQQARAAEEAKKDAAKEAERAADERLRDTIAGQNERARQHNELLVTLKGMSNSGKPDGEELAEIARQNPAALDMMTPTMRTAAMQHLGPDFDYRKPMSEGATKHIADIGSTLGIVDRTIKLLERPETKKDMGPVKGYIKSMVPGSPAAILSGKFALIKQVIGKQMEGGVLRKEDEAKYNEILLNISSNPDLALSQMKEIQTLLKNTERVYRDTEDSQGRRGNPHVPKSGAGAGAPPPAGDVKKRADDLLSKYGGTP
jgi:hypothetical protein